MRDLMLQRKLPSSINSRRLLELRTSRTTAFCELSSLHTALDLLLGQTIKKLLRSYDIRKDLEHEDDEYEAGVEDCGKDASGQLDYLGRHDLEDIITVSDRRPELLHECLAMPAELRAYLAPEFTTLFASADFEATLAGHLPGDSASQSRLGKLSATLRSFTSL